MILRRGSWLIFLVVVIFLTSCGSSSQTADNGEGNSGTDEGTGDDLPACGSQNTFFTASPLEASAFSSITPLGNLNPSAHTFPTDHTYLMLTDKTQSVSVYAPGDLTITKVIDYSNNYSVTFYSCAEIYGYYDHMTTLVESITSQFNSANACPSLGPSTATTYCPSIQVKAGDQIGSIGGPNADGSAALDFGARDTRLAKTSFINMDGAVNSQYVVCPYDYYVSGSVKDGLVDKLKSVRTTEPFCGTVALDVTNTAQGRWYLAGSSASSSDESQHLALVPSNFDPNVKVLSVGNSTVGTGASHFDPLSSGLIRRSFADITNDGNTACFDSLRNTASAVTGTALSGRFFLKMTSNTALKLEKDASSSSCPSDPNTWSFTSSAVNFER